METTKIVYSLFKEINQIPRPSWHEEKIADYLMQFASKHNLNASRDAHNCVIIRKQATAGYEKAPIVVILNHMDMVCVATKGKKFDPQTSPIESYIDNGWLKAKETSLGADNGIGLCMALAILESQTIQHPALECIFTTNEEDGMTGAANLASDALQGRLIINLDSEDFDTITVGSAAAYLQFTHIPFSKRNTPENGYEYFNIEISGGLGGHSGVDINKGRNSATKMICELLFALNNTSPLILSDIHAGEASNAIAINAHATIGIKSDKVAESKELLRTFTEQYLKPYTDNDSNVKCSIETSPKPHQIICDEAVRTLLNGVHNTPYGPIEMSKEMKNTVQTSNNTGVIKMDEESIFVSNYSRSFKNSTIHDLGNKIAQNFNIAGASTELIMDAPTWEPNLNSQLLALTEEVFERTLGFKAKKVAMHFALEAGYYMQKFPGTEMVSIGPKIIEPHSTTERVNMETIEDIWKVVQNLLAEIKN